MVRAERMAEPAQVPDTHMTTKKVYSQSGKGVKWPGANLTAPATKKRRKRCKFQPGVECKTGRKAGVLCAGAARAHRDSAHETRLPAVGAVSLFSPTPLLEPRLRGTNRLPPGACGVASQSGRGYARVIRRVAAGEVLVSRTDVAGG